jgi:hypothetical protein
MQVFSVKFLITRQDEVPIFKKIFSARDLMPVALKEKPVIVSEVLWADDKSKPYKNIFGGCPWRWCASSP